MDGYLNYPEYIKAMQDDSIHNSENDIKEIAKWYKWNFLQIIKITKFYLLNKIINIQNKKKTFISINSNTKVKRRHITFHMVPHSILLILLVPVFEVSDYSDDHW